MFEELGGQVVLVASGVFFSLTRAGNRLCPTTGKERTMKKFTKIVGSLVGVLLLGPMVKEAAAIDLTGTWVGTATCLSVLGSIVPPSSPIPITIKITQSGNDLNLSVDLATSGLSGDLNGTQFYDGTILGKNPAKAKKAVAEIELCGNAPPPPDFLGTEGFVESGPKKKASPALLDGVIISDYTTATLVCSFDDVVQTSTADPGVVACP